MISQEIIRCPCDCRNLPLFQMDDIDKVISWLGEKDVPEETKQSILAGMNEEREHCDITAGDPILTAKIALSHLREEPDYYEKLKKAGL